MRTIAIATVLLFGCDPVSQGAGTDAAPANPDAGSGDAGGLDPSADAHHEEILRFRVGFGASAKGGEGGELCVVTSLEDTGAGSLRHCATRDIPTWVRFDVSGIIALKSTIEVSSFTTIDGRGQDVTIAKSGLDFRNTEHIIVTHMTFDDGDGYIDWEQPTNTVEGNDAIELRGASHVWIHQSSFSHFGDGLIDIRSGSTDVTVSWCRFSEHVKVMLILSGPDTRVTTHHNYFVRTGKRHPRLVEGKVHAFNNLHATWLQAAVHSADDAELLSENNIYIGDEASSAVIVNPAGHEPGNARSVGDWVIEGASIDERNPSDVFAPGDFYEYQVGPADGSLRATLESSTGWKQAPFPGL